MIFVLSKVNLTDCSKDSLHIYIIILLEINYKITNPNRLELTRTISKFEIYDMIFQI